MGNNEKKDNDQSDEREQPTAHDSIHRNSGLSLLADVTTLSWNLVLPIVGGVLLGSYLDKRTGNQLTWTMSLLVLGVMVAFGNLYNLYREHGRNQTKNENKLSGNEEIDVEEEKE